MNVTKGCTIEVEGLNEPFLTDEDLDAYLYKHRVSLWKEFSKGGLRSIFSLPNKQVEIYNQLVDDSDKGKAEWSGRSKRLVGASQIYRLGGAMDETGQNRWGKPLIDYNRKKNTNKTYEQKIEEVLDDEGVSVNKNNKKTFGTDFHKLMQWALESKTEIVAKDMSTLNGFVNAGCDLSMVKNLYSHVQTVISKIRKDHPNAKFIIERQFYAKTVHEDMLNAISANDNRLGEDSYLNLTAKPDLIVIDEDNTITIYDWKTSGSSISVDAANTKLGEIPTLYDVLLTDDVPGAGTWGHTKRVDVMSQLAAEQAVFEQSGYKVKKRRGINFVIKFDENLKFKNVEKIEHFKIEADSYLNEARKQIPVRNDLKLDVLLDSTNEISTLYPDATITTQSSNLESRINYYLENYLKPVKEGSAEYKKGNRFILYRAKIVGGDAYIAFPTKEAFRDVLPAYFTELDDAYANRFQDLANQIETNPDYLEEWLKSSTHNPKALLHLKKYIKNGWALETTPELINNGFFLFTKPGRSELVILSNISVHTPVKLIKGSTLLGNKLADGEYGSDSSYILPAEWGRILEMKAMSLISKNQKRFLNEKISQIKVMSLDNGEIVSDELWRLKDNWDRLKHFYKNDITLTSIDSDCFFNDANAAMLIADDLLEQIGYNMMPSLEDLEQKDFNAEEIRKLINQLMLHYPTLKEAATLKPNENNPEYIALHQLLKAYAYFRGKENWLWLSEPDVGQIISNKEPGLSRVSADGLMMTSDDISNSANSRILKRIVGAWSTAVRLELGDIAFEWQKHVSNIQKARGYSAFEGAEFSWFENWFEKDGDIVSDDFILKDPYTDLYFQGESKKAEKDACIFFLKHINQYRKTDDPTKQRWVPLVRASGYEAFINMGLTDIVKEKWKNFMDPIRKDRSGIDDSISNKTTDPNNQFIGMYNPFLDINSQDRTNMLSSHGTEYYSKNLDVVFLRTMEWNLKCKYGEHFLPIINAIRTALAIENNINDGTMKEIETHITKTIDAVVFKKDIVDESLKIVRNIGQALSGLTSELLLAFKFGTLPRDIMTGIGKAVRELVSNSHGDIETRLAGLDISVYLVSLEEALKESLKSGNIMSKSQQLSAIYGTFGYGFGQMSDSFKSYQYGVKNMDDSIVYWTTSAGDYVNRCAILITKLKTRGSYDAYVEDEDGRLRYNMSLDKAYDVYSKFREDESKVPSELMLKYIEQREIYHKCIDNWKALGGKWGNLKYGDDLPHALDPEEQRGLVTQADMLYGNFNSDTKALISKTALGGLFMQMKTYGYAAFMSQIKTGGATNVLEKQVAREFNKKTGKVEKVYKRRTTPEELEVTGQHYVEVYESEVTPEMLKSGSVTPRMDPAGSPMSGRIQTIFATIAAMKKLSPNEWGTLLKNPNTKYNLLSALFETLFASIFAALLGKLYGEDTITHMTDEDWWTRWSWGVLNGIATDGPVWYTMESMFSDGTVPLVSILKRYGDNFLSLIEGNSTVLQTLMNSFGATRELSAYFAE